jgi:HPt (histidine-containing phosphotransfer) domain-containing protein
MTPGAEKICNFNYLTQMMGGKKQVINEIMDAFLKQLPEELQTINDAVAKKDFTVIKNFAHSMRSSVSIMDIAVMKPILQEMENLAIAGSSIERITDLNVQLNALCKQAVEEVEKEKLNYV